MAANRVRPHSGHYRMGVMPEDRPIPDTPHRFYGLFRHRPPRPAESGAHDVKVIFDMVRELSKNEFDLAAEAVQTIGRVLEGFDNNLDRSFKELSESTKRVIGTFASSDSFQDRSNWGPELLHRITNFSVALVMHQAYVISETGHLYGDGSAEHVAVTKSFAELYDASISYRIVYGFRNAIVHSSRRLISPFASSRLVTDPGGGERIESVVELWLGREEFARTKPKAKLRHEILALSEDPEFLSSCNNAWTQTKALQEDLNSILYPKRDAAVQTLWEYLVETAALGGYGPYFDSTQALDPPVAMQMVPVSQSVINYVWAAGIAESRQPAYALIPQIIEDGDVYNSMSGLRP